MCACDSHKPFHCWVWSKVTVTTQKCLSWITTVKKRNIQTAQNGFSTEGRFKSSIRLQSQSKMALLSLKCDLLQHKTPAQSVFALAEWVNHIFWWLLISEGRTSSYKCHLYNSTEQFSLPLSSVTRVVHCSVLYPWHHVLYHTSAVS